MYLCISLGFQGRYRLSSNGPVELDRLRGEIYALILHQHSAIESDLSPRWKGVAAPYRPRAAIPVWVAASVALAIIAALFGWLSRSINAASDNLFLNVPPVGMPQIARGAPTEPPDPPALPAEDLGP